MIAALPWYDLAELRGWTDRFWTGWATHARALGVDAPETLDRNTDPYALLEAPELLVSQICGYVVPALGLGRVIPLMTPRYTAPGCDGSHYRSVIAVGPRVRVARLEELRGARCAINDPLSHSGCNSLRLLVGPLHRGGRFFSEVIVTGAHARSAEALVLDRADVAALDCVTWALLQRARPALTAQLRVIGRTAAAPAPPLVTSAHTPPAVVAALRESLRRWLADPTSAEARSALLFDGVDLRPADDYTPMMTQAASVHALGYHELGG